MKISKNIQSLCQKSSEDKHIDFSLIREEGKRKYAIIKDFNTFMCDYILHLGRKHFCQYFLQAYRTAEISKFHIKNCFKINSKQRIKMSQKGKCVRFKNYEIKIKSSFMIIADLEII